MQHSIIDVNVFSYLV